MPAPHDRSVAGWAVVPAVVAPVALIGGWTLAAALGPQRFDPVTQTISALAGRGEPNRWVVALAVWPAVAGRRRPAAPLLTPRAGAGAAAVLLCLVGWFGAELTHDGPRVGLAERVAAAAQALWPLAVVVVLRRRR